LRELLPAFAPYLKESVHQGSALDMQLAPFIGVVVKIMDGFAMERRGLTL